MRNATRTLLALLFLFTATATASAQDCPPAVIDYQNKKSTLYLYFPTTQDVTFPDYSVYGADTSPLNPFDMSLHDASITTGSVRWETLQKMHTGFCEFDVQVKLETGTPAPVEDRWQIVGIGSDWSNAPFVLIGEAQNVDVGDLIAQDYCRVWVNDLQNWVGAELTGASSTAARWGTAIANLAMHETSHNYGALHEDSFAEPGEDDAPNHFIAGPAEGATASTIVDRLNHHSDLTYEKFGHDLGLAIQTLHNWDFVNPNAQDADAATVRVLSTAGDLTIGWFFKGSLSPWTNPTVTPAGTITFQGQQYNAFDVKFETAKSWAGGPDGVVPGGELFHLGATFLEDEEVIVYQTTLRANGANLPLQPRMFGYDAGTAFDGTFNAIFFNTGAAELLLSDVQVLNLPRMVDIEQMVVGGALIGIGGMDVTPFARQPRDPRDILPDSLAGPVRVGREQSYSMPLARLTDRRHLDLTIGPDDCDGGFGGKPEANDCPTQEGDALSLFPATYTYVMATVTDPNARYWDRRAQRYVDGPLSTRFFFQIAGNVPDANGNGTDDLLDIRRRTSRDDNGNGIPDEAERR